MLATVFLWREVSGRVGEIMSYMHIGDVLNTV